MKYSFCEEAAMLQMECRVSTIQTPFKDAGQIEVVCNKNIGLQCVDELQKDRKLGNLLNAVFHRWY